MTISRDRFEQGMSYEAYKAQMSRNRERLEERAEKIELPGEYAQFFRELPQSLNVVVLTEDWCEPAIASIPVLAALAEASGRLDLRFFLRDQNRDIMDHYLKDGIHPSIPTYVFLDQSFREVGRWHERPARIAELFGEMMGELFATDPLFTGIQAGTPIPQLPEAARSRAIETIVAFGAETREVAEQEFLREIRDLIATGLPAGAVE